MIKPGIDLAPTIDVAKTRMPCGRKSRLAYLVMSGMRAFWTGVMTAQTRK